MLIENGVFLKFLKNKSFGTPPVTQTAAKTSYILDANLNTALPPVENPVK